MIQCFDRLFGIKVCNGYMVHFLFGTVTCVGEIQYRFSSEQMHILWDDLSDFVYRHPSWLDKHGRQPTAASLVQFTFVLSCTHLHDSQPTSMVAVRHVLPQHGLMTFTLATGNTQKCYQAPFPGFWMGPGNKTRCIFCGIQFLYSLPNSLQFYSEWQSLVTAKYHLHHEDNKAWLFQECVHCSRQKFPQQV